MNLWITARFDIFFILLYIFYIGILENGFYPLQLQNVLGMCKHWRPFFYFFYEHKL